MAELFEPRSAEERIRALLATEFGYAIERLDDLEATGHLGDELEAAMGHAKRVAEARAALPQWVAMGLITPERAASLTSQQLATLAYDVFIFDYYARDRTRQATTPAPAPPTEGISRTEVLSLVSELLTLIAAQQTEMQELRRQLADVRASHVAVFGEQQVIEQLTRVDRDFEGFEANLELEEQASSSRESESDKQHAGLVSVDSTGDTSAAIQGVASYIAGLDVGRTVNNSRLNQSVERLRKSATERAKVYVRGRVQLRIAKVTRGR